MPLAVRPEHQRRGIGSRLIRDGVERLRGTGAAVLLVYGDPDYYGRFGFTADASEGFTAPYPLRYPFGWQGMTLGELEPRSAASRIACVPPLRDPALW